MSEYNNINNDDQWTTADQWREEEKTEEKKTKKSKESKDGRWWLRICASAVAFGLIAGLVMQGVMFGFSKAGVGSTGTQLATTNTSSSSSSSSSNDLSSVSENVMPSIVSIT